MIIKIKTNKKNINVIFKYKEKICYCFNQHKKKYNFVKKKIIELIIFYKKHFFLNYKYLGLIKKIVNYINKWKIN